MYSAVIVDDEHKVRGSIVQMLKIYCPNVEVIGEADGVNSGYELITRCNPTVVFLDVQMLDGLGFELLSKFENPTFQVIIITAYHEYAIEAFKFSALDYLLKPIDPSDLIMAVQRLEKTVNIATTRAKYSALSANLKNEDGNAGKLVLKTVDEAFIVDIDSIIRCEACNNTTTFYIEGFESLKVSKTLKEYEDLLSSKGFFRCHQSHLINRKHLVKVLKYPSAMARMDDGFDVPIAVRKQGLL